MAQPGFTASYSLYQTSISYRLVAMSVRSTSITASSGCGPGTCQDSQQCCEDADGTFKGCCDGTCCYDAHRNSMGCASDDEYCCATGIACPVGSACCGDSCVPEDDGNCGTCNNACGFGQTCLDGSCVCTEGQPCGDRCCPIDYTCCTGLGPGLHTCCRPGTSCNWRTGVCKAPAPGTLINQGQASSEGQENACKVAAERCLSGLPCRHTEVGKCNCWKLGPGDKLGWTCSVPCTCSLGNPIKIGSKLN